MKREFPVAGKLAQDSLVLAKVLARNAFLPHPDVVAQVQGAVWPCIRANRELGKRGTVVQLSDGPVLLDDNTVPRWVLLIAHGFGPNLPMGKRGWSFAHVWSEPRCRHSYTALANLAMVEEPLAGLTDKASPVALFLRYHAWRVYGWKPPGRPEPEKPSGFDDICWQYFDPAPAPRADLTAHLAGSGNVWAKHLRQII